MIAKSRDERLGLVFWENVDFVAATVPTLKSKACRTVIQQED